MSGANQKRATILKRAVIATLFLLLTLRAAAPVTEKAYRSVGERLICQCGCMQSVYGCNDYGCPQSDNLRKEVRAALAETDSEDGALEVMVKKYGPKILMEPPKSGFSLTAWIMPFFVLLAGGGLVMLVLRGWRHQHVARAVAAGKVPVDNALIDKYARDIDREIDKD